MFAPTSILIRTGAVSAQNPAIVKTNGNGIWFVFAALHFGMNPISAPDHGNDGSYLEIIAPSFDRLRVGVLLYLIFAQSGDDHNINRSMKRFANLGKGNALTEACL